MILDQMNYEALLIPLNKFYDLHIGGLRRPVFFDIAATRPELLELDRNFAVIREELLGILPEKRSIPRYHELDLMQYNISARVDPDRDWKVYPLNIMGVKPEAFCRRCPRTTALLDGIPGLFEAFFSILEGGKSIPATRARTGAICDITSACWCRTRIRRRSGSRTRCTLGRKAKASSSTTVGTTRSTTRARGTAWC